MQRIMIDWQLLCSNIRSKRPLKSIAKELGCNYAVISHIGRDETSEPKFSVGVKLLDIHLDLMGVDKHRGLLR